MSVAAKQVYIGPVKWAMNVNMHVQILLQKEDLISATTIRNFNNLLISCKVWIVGDKTRNIPIH